MSRILVSGVGNNVAKALATIVFASYKIGESGAAEGLLTAGELENLYRSLE